MKGVRDPNCGTGEWSEPFTVHLDGGIVRWLLRTAAFRRVQHSPLTTNRHTRILAARLQGGEAAQPVHN